MLYAIQFKTHHSKQFLSILKQFLVCTDDLYLNLSNLKCTEYITLNSTIVSSHGRWLHQCLKLNTNLISSVDIHVYNYRLLGHNQNKVRVT